MRYTKQTKIGVLCGGLSAEREVSLRTGKALLQGLMDRGYTNLMLIDTGRDIADQLVQHGIEVAVLALHGRYGEDGTIQGILEYLQIPYTGSGVMGSAISLNKVVTKELFKIHQVPTPKWVVAKGRDPRKIIPEIEGHLGFPCICKPIDEGSTFGFSIVRSGQEIMEAQEKALQFGEETLWEEMIAGRELTVGILEGRALPIIEIVPKSGLYDYESKYTKGKTEYICPAQISQEEAVRVSKVAQDAFACVRADDFGRVDVLLRNGEPYVLEVNTIPGMTETSLLPKAAQAMGITFPELAEKLLQLARLKQGEKK